MAALPLRYDAGKWDMRIFPTTILTAGILGAALFLLTAAPVFATDLDDRLWLTASNGDLEGAKAALEDGADVDYARGDLRLSVLDVAASNLHADIVTLLLGRGANVNIANKLGATPLIGTISSISSKVHDKVVVAQLLMTSGADVRHADGDRWTPLHWAAREANRDIAKMLLDRGADVNALNKNDETPLDVASDALISDFLLARGGRIGGISGDGTTPLAAIDRELFMAAVAGSAPRIRLAVRRGAHVNIRDGSQNSALIRAVHFGRLEAVNALLDAGADVDLSGGWGFTPLHVAAGQGLSNIVEVLVAHRARINARNSYKETALDEASNAETAAMLLRAGAQANLSEKLCSAARDDNAKLVELLITYGADTNSKCRHDSTPLLSAILGGKNWDIVAILLDHGTDPNISDDSGTLPLLLAAGLEGSADAVAQLLSHGAIPNASDKDGDTALIEAAKYGRIDIVKLLLEHGANVAAKGDRRITALGATKDVETADVLISRGADTDDILDKDTLAKFDNRQKALFKAVIADDDKNIMLAVVNRSELSRPFPDGTTPLQIATMFGRSKMIDWLVEHGVDPAKPDADGLVPLHVAVTSPLGEPQKIRVMESLLKHGAAIDPVDQNGRTPLHLAAASYSQAVVEFLLRRGADPLRRTKDGRTPIQVAQRSEAGTGLLGTTISQDLKRKSAPIETLRSAVSGLALPR
jgi:ankyrin repeat protein